MSHMSDDIMYENLKYRRGTMVAAQTEYRYPNVYIITAQ